MKKALLGAVLALAPVFSATQAAANDCSATDVEFVTGFASFQKITWTNGGVWQCISPINKDIVKAFSKGTASRYYMVMASFDNCKVYKRKAGSTTWNYWFTPDGGSLSQTFTRSQIGTETNGIRLGC